MERRLKEHIDEAFEGLENQITELQDSINKSDTNCEDMSDGENSELLREELKETEERLSKRLDEISQGLERQLRVILRLNSSTTKGGKKRSAAEAFGTNQDEVQTRTTAGHDSLFKRLERRLGMHVSDTQTHMESAVYEMKSGTFERLADLDERIGAMEEKMDRLARFMAIWEAVSSANTGPSAL